MDTGTRLTCLTVASPMGLLKELTEDPVLQDPVTEESEETMNQAQTCERVQTAPSTSGKEVRGKGRRREMMVSKKRSCCQGEPSSPCTRTKKKTRVKTGLAEKASKSRTLRSGVKIKPQGKMSRRRLLLREKYLKQHGHKK